MSIYKLKKINEFICENLFSCISFKSTFLWVISLNMIKIYAQRHSVTICLIFSDVPYASLTMMIINVNNKCINLCEFTYL